MSDLSDNLQIDTPENVLLDAEIAGVGTRIAAAFIDYFILFIVVLAVTFLYTRSIRSAANGTTVLAIWGLIQFAIVTFYHLFFEFLWNGQTPGKRWLNLRVVQANGMPLTTAGAVIRNLIRLFDFLPLFYGIGLIVLFVTKHTQRLGDLAAGTIVIREQRKVTLDNVRESFHVDYQYLNRYSPKIPEYVKVETLTEADRADIVNYLQRRKEMRRGEYAAWLLAQRIANKMGATELKLFSPSQSEMFLEQVARAFELHGTTQTPVP